MNKYLLIFLTPLLLLGCLGEAEVIEDTLTEKEVRKVIREEHMIIYNHNDDNMDRGEHDYYKETLVVDTNFDLSQLKRGDVILFDYPTTFYENNVSKRSSINSSSISRIIGLPSENVEIIASQIYINDKKLDTFYGKEHWRGVDLERYQLLYEQGNQAEDIISFIERMENNNMNSLKIPENHVYVIGDTWGRSSDSNTFGPLPISHIKGKVLGYEQK